MWIHLQVIGCVFRRFLDRNVWFHKAWAIAIIVSTGKFLSPEPLGLICNNPRFKRTYDQ